MEPPPPPPAPAPAATTAATDPIFISTDTLQSLLAYESLITHLKATLPAATRHLATPPRHSLPTSATSTLLLMPSFSTSPSLPYTGVKIVTHHPLSSPSSVHAAFVLFSSLNGQTLALMDASLLTLLRTAAVSALASFYLSNPNPKTLVLVGSGSLAPHLARAHFTVRTSIRRIIIWNRTELRAIELAARLKGETGFKGVEIESCHSLDEAVPLGDIVSCATNSEAVLVKGMMLKEGAHLDLVGSFKVIMRECDDEAIRRGKVFVDCEAAMEEAGEIVGAFERGLMRKEDVGSLVELISGEKEGRVDEKEISVFKSVGSGVVDVLAAQLIYETYMKKQ